MSTKVVAPAALPGIVDPGPGTAPEPVAAGNEAVQRHRDVISNLLIQ